MSLAIDAEGAILSPGDGRCMPLNLDLDSVGLEVAFSRCEFALPRDRAEVIDDCWEESDSSELERDTVATWYVDDDASVLLRPSEWWLGGAKTGGTAFSCLEDVERWMSKIRTIFHLWLLLG